MLYSQNEKLYRACDDGNVSRVSELIAEGANINCRDPHTSVSIVSGHMMLVTYPYTHQYLLPHTVSG